MKAFVVAGAVLALAGAAQAAVIKVPQQFDTIQEAVDNAASGDVILVSAGVYNENVTIGTSNLTLTGKKAIVDGTIVTSDGTCFNINADNVVVQGFTFRNGDYHVLANGSGIVVTKCLSVDPSNYNVYINGDGAVVTSNRLYGAGTYALYINGADALVQKNQMRQTDSTGMYVTGQNAIIVSNTIVNCEDSYGIEAAGNNAFVSANKVMVTDSYGIYVYGTNAQVLSNRISFTTSTGVYGSADGVIIEGNRTVGTYYGIECYGNGTVTASNRVEGTQSTGIYVGGDDVTVTGNLVRWVPNDSYGFNIYSNTIAGGGLVESNRAEDTAQEGFYSSTIYNMTYRRNVALRCGAEDEGGFYFNGNANTIEDCLSQESDNDGFRINGNNNTFVRCIARNGGADGFDVDGGTNSIFNACVALNNGGEGMDNAGTNTQLQGGTYKGNRIDISVAGAGSYVGGLTSVTYVTGGVGVTSQVD